MAAGGFGIDNCIYCGPREQGGPEQSEKCKIASVFFFRRNVKKTSYALNYFTFMTLRHSKVAAYAVFFNSRSLFLEVCVHSHNVLVRGVGEWAETLNIFAL